MMSANADISRLEASFESSREQPEEPQDRDLGSDLDLSDDAFEKKCEALIGIGQPSDAEVAADKEVQIAQDGTDSETARKLLIS